MISYSTAFESNSESSDLNTVNEEFFENALFQDVADMKSLAQVSEKTAYNLKDLQDQVYQTLFDVFQKTRGISSPSNSRNDDLFTIFELFLKNYYQHFRTAMETLSTETQPLKIAYYLGKNSDKLILMLDQFIREMKEEIS